MFKSQRVRAAAAFAAAAHAGQVRNQQQLVVATAADCSGRRRWAVAAAAAAQCRRLHALTTVQLGFLGRLDAAIGAAHMQCTGVVCSLS